MRGVALHRGLAALAVVCAAFVAHAGEPAGDGDASTSSAELAAPGDDEIARVLALPGDAAWGEYLAGECATCHGAAPGDGAVPVIRGTDAARIVRALLEYRAGVRTNTTMRSVAGALGDEEIAVLAHHLAATVP